MIEKEQPISFSKFFEDWCEKVLLPQESEPHQDYCPFSFEIDDEKLCHVLDYTFYFELNDDEL